VKYKLSGNRIKQLTEDFKSNLTYPQKEHDKTCSEISHCQVHVLVGRSEGE